MPDTIFAYLDPGTGNYLLQLAIAGAIGGSYAIRRFWAQIKSLFGRSASSHDER